MCCPYLFLLSYVVQWYISINLLASYPIWFTQNESNWTYKSWQIKTLAWIKYIKPTSFELRTVKVEPTAFIFNLKCSQDQ